jgi:hypothetical protein
MPHRGLWSGATAEVEKAAGVAKEPARPSAPTAQGLRPSRIEIAALPARNA